MPSPQQMPGGDRVRRGLTGRSAAAIAAFGYLLITLAFTSPLVLHFDRAIPGDGFDGWQNYWNLWWVKVALVERHTTPFFTDLLYSPTGVGLLFHTLNPFNGLASLPIQLAFGLFPAYNSVVLFSFAVAGLGGYLLARQALGSRSSRLAAFVAGVIFTYAPVHVAHLLGHMQVISLEWIPFFVLYLLRAAGGGRRAHLPAAGWRDIGLAAFFLTLVTLCDWYFVLYCLIFTAVVGAWYLLAVFRRRAAAPTAWRGLSAVAAIWLIWAAVLSPLLWPMVREASQSRFMVPDPAQSRVLSADLLAFVTPQGFHPLWGEWARAQGTHFTASISEHTVFAGYVTLALAALGGWAGRRRGLRSAAAPSSAGPHEPWRFSGPAGFWLAVFLVFFVISLGPVLHIGGRTALLPGGGEIPLPYGWLVRVVPFMEITRSISRYDIMVMLALAVLAAWGMDWLRRPERSRWLRWVAPVAGIGILFEFLPAPYPLSRPDTPAWYHTLAADPRPGAVLNLPMNWDRPGYLLYQTVHGKPLTAAYISRDDPRTLVERAPVLQHFRRLGPDIIALDLAGQGQGVLADLGVRWVTLDRYKMPGGPERQVTEAIARQIFGDQPAVYRDERLTVYEIGPTVTRTAYLILDTGWGPFDPTSHTRAFADRAGVIVRSPEQGAAVLRVVLAADSAALAAVPDGDAFVMALALQPGDNRVTLRSREPGQRVVVRELSLLTRGESERVGRRFDRR